jgi:hypothetical protein
MQRSVLSDETNPREYAHHLRRPVGGRHIVLHCAGPGAKQLLMVQRTLEQNRFERFYHRANQ